MLLEVPSIDQALQVRPHGARLALVNSNACATVTKPCLRAMSMSCIDKADMWCSSLASSASFSSGHLTCEAC